MTHQQKLMKATLPKQIVSKTKLVHVNMTNDTLEKIDEVKDRIHAENKTTAIRYSIDIAAMITKVMSKGGKVILEEDGQKYLMKIPGLS